MTDTFKEIGSLFGREGAGAGFAKQTDKESFTYAFAWPEGDTWATLTGYLNLDEQPEEYVRRVLQDGGFRSDWGNPDYDPIGDFKETAGYLSQLDYSKVVEMGDFYTVLNGDIVAVGFDPETGESRSLTDGETARVEGYFTVISRPGSGAKAVDDIRHGITPGSYDISVESHDCTSGRNALAADAPARDAPGKDNQNIG